MIGIQALTGVFPLDLNHDKHSGELLWQPFGALAGSTLRHGLVAVLSRMVRTNHTQRYPSAKEALQALQQLTQAVPLTVMEPESIAPTPVPVDSVLDSVLDPVLNSVPADQPLTPPSSAESLAGEVVPEQQMGAAMQIGVGIGAVIAAAVCGYALPHLLDRRLLHVADPDQQALAEATQQYQAGQLQKAVSLAEKSPKAARPMLLHAKRSPTGKPTGKPPSARLKPPKPPFSKGIVWQSYGKHRGYRKNNYWQAQVQPLVQQSSSQAEAAAAQLLRDAYGRAIVKDFAGAIVALKQIPEGTSVHTRAQEKLREYGEKQKIQAVSYLQTAYNQAEAKTFDKALETLQKISTDTPTYSTAKAKTREYAEKQRIRADALALQDLNPGSGLQEANAAVR